MGWAELNEAVKAPQALSSDAAKCHEGIETDEFYSTPERIDPFPFTPEGRLYQQLEHELSLTQAILRVGALTLEKSKAQAKKRRARKRRDQRLR